MRVQVRSFQYYCDHQTTPTQHHFHVGEVSLSSEDLGMVGYLLVPYNKMLVSFTVVVNLRVTGMEWK